MRKSLLIGLMVCVLAVGAIGAAFATVSNFPGGGVGALATGYAEVPEVHVTELNWGMESDPEPYIDFIRFKVNKDLTAGTGICVNINEAIGGPGRAWYELTAAVPAGTDIKVHFPEVLVKDVTSVRITIDEPSP